MKLLNGLELAGYIKERQAKQVRSLRQAFNIYPKLAIIVTIDHPAIETYVRLKQAYGQDILVDVDVYKIQQEQVNETLKQLNQSSKVQAIIIQLPLANPLETDQIINLINPSKDVDGLSLKSEFESATPMAILWLLGGYNIELNNKNILLVGQGKLVGAPLLKILNSSGIEPTVADKSTQNLKSLSLQADLIITATGTKGLITSDMLKPGAIVVDAGVASEEAKIFGDVDVSVYDTRDDLTITPLKGGVGPLTVCALFENVIRACQKQLES